MDTFVYLRISQDRTGEEQGIARQREDARKLAELRGWRIVREFIDNETSASGKVKRPAFAAMLAALAAGEAQCVIAWDMTRLSRNARDTLALMEVGQAAGATISMVKGSDLNLASADGRTMANILSSIAQGEIDKKSERQKRSAEQAAGEGKRIGGRRPFGYDSTGMVKDRKEAAAVRWAYLALLAGVSLGGVARRWNERGLITPQAAFGHGCGGTCADGVRPRSCPERTADQPSTWTAQTVRAVILNPRYAGLRSHVTDRVRKAHPNPRAARIAGVVGPATWPEIVNEQTWRATVALITSPSRTKFPRSGAGLLTGLALCGVCGETVHGGGAPARRGRDGYRTYRCSAAYGHLGRAAQVVEWFVTEVVLARLTRSDAATLLAADDRPDADEVRVSLLALKSRRRNVLDLVEDGTYTAAEARERVARLDKQIREAEAGLTNAGRVDVLGPLIGAADVRAEWLKLGTERQRAVLRVLFSTVRLMPPGRGTRLGTTTEDWEENVERIGASIRLVWAGETA